MGEESEGRRAEGKDEGERERKKGWIEKITL